ncbi:hypothetical protein EDC04DRAFT_2675660 [Pisolithus marmoratus]|nr:hypothetical protein EDC04DRAFT_2675660 [Pisolithus marmoratus]
MYVHTFLSLRPGVNTLVPFVTVTSMMSIHMASQFGVPSCSFLLFNIYSHPLFSTFLNNSKVTK